MTVSAEVSSACALKGLWLDASYRQPGNQDPFKVPLKGFWATALKGRNSGGCLCGSCDALYGRKHYITPGHLHLHV